jgi:hypothetical protein
MATSAPPQAFGQTKIGILDVIIAHGYLIEPVG